MRDSELRYIITDHEEWLRVVEKADGVVFTMHGFMAYNASALPGSPRRLITDQRVVEKAVEKLRDRFGWGTFAGVPGPMTTIVPVFDARSGDEPRYLGNQSRSVEGGWWVVVPVDYHEHLHDPERCEFRVRVCGRDVALYAREYAEKRVGKTSLGEFDYTTEYALTEGEIYIFNDHPEAAEHMRDLIEREEGRGSQG